jgi:hypothetical protein
MIELASLMDLAIISFSLVRYALATFSSKEAIEDVEEITIERLLAC